MRVSEALRTGAHRGDAVGVEGHRLVVEDLLKALHLDARFGRDSGNARAQFGVHGREHGIFRMADVDGEEHAAGNHVARIGVVLDHADSCAGKWRMGEADPVDEVNHACGAEQGVLATRHRRRSGV